MEKQMLEILKRGKDVFGFNAVKAEFEAEGTRFDEFLRLVEIARRADVKIGLKIGGCEAMRDLMEAKQVGVDYLIAPMVETPYALSKFVDAKNKVFKEEDQSDVGFLTNLETIVGYNHLSEMVRSATVPNGINGLVFGRVDFVSSMGLDGRNSVNNREITEMVMATARACRDSKLDMVMGGGISLDAIESIREVQKVHLTRYETRKIIFNGDAITSNDADKGIMSAVQFELLWLKNKQEYYGTIHMEDAARIKMLESRYSTN